MKTIRVAIDGPSGAGKSTLARAAAGELGYLYVDTGAIYRTVGYYVCARGLDPKDGEAVAAALPEISVEMAYREDGLQRMLLNGEDVTEAIRLPEISLCASAVSAHPGVRGIGTVVLPDAEVKVFLTASPEARARRRCLELEGRGTPQPYEKVLEEIQERDWNDTHRSIAPLRQAEDAVLLDTTDLDFQESREALLAILRERTNGA